MDDAALMSRFEGVGDLPRDPQRFVDRHGALPNPVGKRLAFDQLHDERADSRGVGNAIEVRDVGVIERAEYFGFPLKALEPFRIGGDVRRKQFQRNLSLQLRIAGAVNLAHATHAKRGDDVIGAETSPQREWHAPL